MLQKKKHSRSETSWTLPIQKFTKKVMLLFYHLPVWIFFKKIIRFSFIFHTFHIQNTRFLYISHTQTHFPQVSHTFPHFSIHSTNVPYILKFATHSNTFSIHFPYITHSTCCIHMFHKYIQPSQSMHIFNTALHTHFHTFHKFSIHSTNSTNVLHTFHTFPIHITHFTHISLTFPFYIHWIHMGTYRPHTVRITH